MTSYRCSRKRKAHHESEYLKVLAPELLFLQVVAEFVRCLAGSADLAPVVHRHELEPDSGRRRCS